MPSYHAFPAEFQPELSEWRYEQSCIMLTAVVNLEIATLKVLHLASMLDIKFCWFDQRETDL